MSGAAKKKREDELSKRASRGRAPPPFSAPSSSPGLTGNGAAGAETTGGAAAPHHHALNARTTVKTRRKRRTAATAAAGRTLLSKKSLGIRSGSSSAAATAAFYFAVGLGMMAMVACCGLLGWAWLKLDAQQRLHDGKSGYGRSSLQKLNNDGGVDGNGIIFPPPYPKITKFDEEGGRVPGLLLSDEAIQMCTNALWHTVETTTIVLPDREAFVHTGDIDDLWLRDSASQVHPLLVPFSKGSGKALIADDPRLDRVVSGLIKRTATYIRHDPYANAFRIDDTYIFNEMQKKLGRHDLISTWNYELDSACFYIRMLHFYWKQSPNGGETPDSVLRLKSVHEAIVIMVDLWISEQRHEDDEYPKGPLFDCKNCNKPYRYPGLARDGKGTLTNATSGLTWTGFRPSDDMCRYGYLVPANMFAAVALGYVREMATDIWHDSELAGKAQKLASEIRQGINDHGIVQHHEFGKIYAYEVDGLGNSFLMDDANVPSLLSIPYLGYDYDPKVYANTRRFIFSPSNPEYRKGTNDMTGDIEGYGSPHMSQAIRDNIWPMSIAVQGLTSDSVEEKLKLVEKLVKASAGTHWMHESFDVHNPHRFTRSWFCWADSLFAELVMSLTDKCPDPSRKYKVMEWRDPETVHGGPYAVSEYE